MSPVKRPSAVSGLRHATAAPESAKAEADLTASAPQRQRREKPVRITVDLTPGAYTALHKWLAGATEVGERKPSLSAAIRALVDELREDPALADRIRARVWEAKGN